MRSSSRRNSGSSDLGGWVLRGGIAAFFVAFGLEKFGTSPHSPWVDIFARIGFGQWFRFATGCIECAGGLLFVAPKTCPIGAAILATTMAGAVLAHVTVLHDPMSGIMPMGALAAVVMIARRDPDGDTLARWRPDRNKA